MIELAAAIDWKAIQVPDAARKWAEKVPVVSLEAAIRAAKDKYYNTDEELVPDAAYNAIEEVLEKRKPDSKALAVGSEIKSPLKKVPLSVWLGSQNKIKSESMLTTFLTKQGVSSYVVTAKLDGKAFLYENRGGRFFLTSRGVGNAGTDLSHLIKPLRLPAIPRGAKVRGEIMMSPAKWAKAWVKTEANPNGFKNERALVAGVTNRQDKHPALKDLDCFAFEIIDGGTQEQQLRQLKTWGFRVPPYVVVKDPTFKSLLEILKRWASGPFKIDGLVIAANVAYKQIKDGNPTHASAFKPTRESGFSLDTEIEATIDHIQWNESKLSYYIPRVMLKPVQLDGVTVRHAAGHNAAYIIEKKLGPGAVVTIVRSGQVIPYITGVVKPARKPQMPSSPYVIVGVNAVAKQKSVQTEIRRADAFFSELQIEGLREASIVKLFEAGYTLETLLAEAYEQDYVDILGANGSKIYPQIEALYSDPPTLDWLLSASGIFKNIGQKNFVKLTDAIPDLLKAPKADVLKKMNDIHGWGPEYTKEFTAKFAAFKAFLKETGLVPGKPKKKAKPTSNRLKGHIVVFTKFRDANLADQIIKNGGQVNDSYSGKTTVVLCPSGMSSNTSDKASAEGKLMTPEAYKKAFKLT